MAPKISHQWVHFTFTLAACAPQVKHRRGPTPPAPPPALRGSPWPRSHFKFWACPIPNFRNLISISQFQNSPKYFIEENRFIANPYRDEPFSEYVQAATDCKFIVFSNQQWNNLSNTILEWDKIMNKIFHNALMKKMDRRSSLVSEDATTRYLIFLEKFPNLVDRTPLSYIASYLGIT